MDIDVNGHKAYAYTGGKPFDAGLPCVVFIHGAQNDHSVWTLQSRWFAHHGFAVLAVDLPGHGRSGGRPLASIEDLADWIELLLEKVMRSGIPGDGAGSTAKNVTLVGHSMGSLTALECASRHPARIAAHSADRHRGADACFRRPARRGERQGAQGHCHDQRLVAFAARHHRR